MENTQEIIYTVLNGHVENILFDLHYGDKIELLSNQGQKAVYKFQTAGCRKKDLKNYVKLAGDAGVEIMAVNFKDNTLTPVDGSLREVIDKEMAGAVKAEKEKIAEAKGKAKQGETQNTYASYFTGSAAKNYFLKILTVFVTTITLGLAYPAMLCKYMRWKVNHTYLNGRKLVFSGEASELFGKYIIWWLLSCITFGIYYVLKMHLNLVKWETEHTHVDGNKDAVSTFDGKWYGLLGVTILCRIVTVVTLSFGAYWAHCYKERWFAKHKFIDGEQLIFDGTGIQFFGKCIVWALLTIVTLGIYSYWMAIKVQKWTTKHTMFVNPKNISVKPVDERHNNAYTAFSLVNVGIAYA